MTTTETRPYEAGDVAHGTEAGYRTGCRQSCCTTAHAAKAKADRAAAKARRTGVVTPVGAAPIDLRPDSAGITMPAGRLEALPLDALRPADDNVRRSLGDLTELTTSIAAQGILQPLLVNDAGDGTYRLVAGHRRHAAALQAGLTEAPCFVRTLDEIGRLEAMLVENMQRVDIDPLEEAMGMSRLAELTGLGQRAIGDRLGRSQAHVSKRLALLDLPEVARTALDAGELSLDDAHQLVKLKDHADRIGEVLKARKRDRYRTVGQLVEHELFDLERKKKIAAAIAALPADTKYEVVEYTSFWSTPYKEIGNGYGQVPVSRTNHKGLSCLLAVIDRDARVHWCCKRPASHPEYKAKDASGRGELTDQQKAERVESRRRNKELKKAAAVRLTSLRRLVALAGPPPEPEVIRAWWDLYQEFAYHREIIAVACELVASPVPESGARGASARAPRSGLDGLRQHPARQACAALTLAAGEARVRNQNFGDELVADLYRRLREVGYQPCPDEESLLRAAAR